MIESPLDEIPFEELAEIYQREDDVPDRRIQNDISELNNALHRINFPWQLSTKSANVLRSR
jgi:hypothetical protein